MENTFVPVLMTAEKKTAREIPEPLKRCERQTLL